MNRLKILQFYEMNYRNRKLTRWLLPLLFLVLSTFRLSAEKVKIIGEANDTDQVVADGQIYEIAGNKIGDERVTRHISSKVEVNGRLQIKGDVKEITVIRYRVIPNEQLFNRSVGLTADGQRRG